MNVFHFCDSIACYRKYLNKNEASSFIFRPFPKILLSVMNAFQLITLCCIVLNKWIDALALRHLIFM